MPPDGVIPADISQRHTAAIRPLGWAAAGFGLMAIGYATIAAAAWYRYGRPAPPSPDERDALLDRFMPVFDVAERHHVRVAAPAAATLEAAAQTDLYQSTIVRAIFRTRELILSAPPESATQSSGLLAQMTSLGWRVLADEPGREIVVGAVTQPWLPQVVFRGLSPDEFAPFGSQVSSRSSGRSVPIPSEVKSQSSGPKRAWPRRTSSRAPSSAGTGRVSRLAS